jgi:hypothetical protein
MVEEKERTSNKDTHGPRTLGRVDIDYVWDRDLTLTLAMKTKTEGQAYTLDRIEGG